MSAIFSFYGASDDLVEVDGPEDSGADEFTVDLHDRWRGLLTAPDGTAIEVIARYGDNKAGDCWSFAIAQPEEGRTVPTWPISLTLSESSYSVRLVVEAPTGTQLIAEATS